MPKKKNTEQKTPKAGAVELTEQELDKAQGGGRIASIRRVSPDVIDPASFSEDPKPPVGSFKAT